MTRGRPPGRPAAPAAGLLIALAALPFPAAAASSPQAAALCGGEHVAVLEASRASARLMPPALRGLLERHAAAVEAGLAAGRSAGSKAEAAAHVQGPAGDIKGAADSLAASVARITALLDSRARMSEVAREMGVAAHLVGDLSDPFRTAPDDPDASLFGPRFRSYVQEHLADLRVIFEGYTDPLLEAGEVAAFGRRLAAVSRSYLDDVIGAYRQHETSADPALLDKRSIPFGVASLTYSRTVTDTARVWLHAWRAAHGDLTGLPFPLEPADAAAGATDASAARP